MSQERKAWVHDFVDSHDELLTSMSELDLGDRIRRMANMSTEVRIRPAHGSERLARAAYVGRACVGACIYDEGWGSVVTWGCALWLCRDPCSVVAR